MHTSSPTTSTAPSLERAVPPRRLSPWAHVCALAALVCCVSAAPASRVSVAGGEAPGAPKDAAIAPAQEAQLPNKPDSLKFAVIGDNGNGEKSQYEIAQQMSNWHGQFPYELVVMMGDNIYGSERPQDFIKKFEAPYKPLLDGGVKFYACLGNHDEPSQRFYKPFNMEGKRYYTVRKGDAEFFVLDSTYMSPAQLEWLRDALSKSDAKWK